MRQKVLIAVALLITFTAGWLVGFSWRPPYPEKWDRIVVGMPMAEVAQLEPRLSADMRGEKGFDQTTVDFGDRYWQLLVWVDSALRVRSAEKHYVFKRCGLWNKTIVHDLK
jgi:hypothetical protein